MTAPTASRIDLSSMLADTRNWLLGEVSETPHHLGPPCPETQPLLPVLLLANSRGLLTIGSQPGVHHGPWWQRAYLDAICAPAAAEHLVDHLTRAGLLADHWPLSHPPTGRGQLTVTVGPDAARTISLQPAGTADARPDGEPTRPVPVDDPTAYACQQEISHAWPDQHAILSRCHAVLLVDPHWGPSALLWTELLRALNCPGHHHGPDRCEEQPA